MTNAAGIPLMPGRGGFMGTMIFVYAGCACAELFRATGEERFREEARSCFTNYLAGLKESEHFSRSELFPPMRRRGCYMHLCHLCRTMLVCGCEFDDKVRTALEMTFEIIPRFYCPEAGRWLESVPTDGGFRLESSLFRTVIPGHDFETMWFLIQGAELAGNREILGPGAGVDAADFRLHHRPEERRALLLYGCAGQTGLGRTRYGQGMVDAQRSAAGGRLLLPNLGRRTAVRALPGGRRVELEAFPRPRLSGVVRLVNYDGTVSNGFKGSPSKTFLPPAARASTTAIQVFKQLAK